MLKRLFKLCGVCLALAALPSASAGTLDDVRARGTIKVGVSMFLPWTMTGKDGLIGFEVDVAREVASDLGLKAELVVVTWEDILPALERGEIDMIAAGLAVTAKRALAATLSRPYSSDGSTLTANRGLTRDFQGLDDFNRPSVTIGTVTGTVYGAVARKAFNKAGFKTYAEPAQAEDAVRSGEIHAYAASVAKTNYLARAYPDVLDAPLPTPLRRSKAAFAVKRGERDFVDFLNAWIIEHEASGWLEAKRSYWFDSLDWAAQLK